MKAVVLVCVLGTLSFGLLTCVAKVAQRKKCNSSALVVWLFGWATLAMFGRSLTMSHPAHVTTSVTAIAIVFGICAAVGYLAVQVSIAVGRVTVGWLMMNLSSGIPALVSIWLYAEKLTLLKSICIRFGGAIADLFISRKPGRSSTIAVRGAYSVPFRPGQFVLQGETLASISPASAQASLAPLVVRNITMGRHRFLSQDVEFGVAQIVEIAIRALSPAINDTFTGIASVDLLGEALTILAEAPQSSGRWFDANEELRLQVRPLLLPRLVKQAFDQIRQAAADNPAVLIRLLSTIGRLAPKLPGADARNALLEEAAAVWETANTKPLVKMDREDIEAAWQKTRSALASLETRDTVGLDVAS
jgi:Predicted membrane protein (DUF2254)